MANVPKDKFPTFMVRALRDVDGANLNRIGLPLIHFSNFQCSKAQSAFQAPAPQPIEYAKN
jgi:hypothetical protein